MDTLGATLFVISTVGLITTVAVGMAITFLGVLQRGRAVAKVTPRE